MTKATKAHVGVPKTNSIQLRHLPDSLELCYDAKRKPVMIWGPPGIAKSAHAQQFAAQKNLPYFDIRLAHFDPVDFKGIPYVDTMDVPEGLDINCDFVVEDDGGKVRKMRITRFAPPDILPFGPAVICLEELPNALPSIQIIASRILLDRSMDGGWKAHKDTHMIATGNRRGDRSGANALLMNLDNRVIHYEVTPDLDYWLQWVLDNYSKTEEARRAAADLVTFMKYMPQASYDFDADASFTDAHGYPTYRSWHMALDLLESCYKKGVNPAGFVPRASIAGAVGISSAEMFFKFIELQSQLPNVDEILAGKGSFQIPDKIDVLYSFIGAVAYKTKPANINRVWEIVEAFEKNEKGEWSVLLVRLASKFCDEFTNHPKLKKFVVQYRHVMGLSER